MKYIKLLDDTEFKNSSCAKIIKNNYYFNNKQ